MRRYELEPASDVADSDHPAAVPRAFVRLVVAVIIGASAAALVRSAAAPGDEQEPTALAASGVAVIYGATVRSGDVARVDVPAPELTWVTSDGRLDRLSALRGRPVVINFWATWCVPCRTEMPELDHVASEDPSVAILAVNLQEDATTVKSFVERLALRGFVPMLDPDGGAARRYGVVSLPTTFFIDRDGVVRHVEVGGTLTREHLRSDLLELTRR